MILTNTNILSMLKRATQFMIYCIKIPKERITDKMMIAGFAADIPCHEQNVIILEYRITY